MFMECEVAVIGAGIIGASVAARLSRAGINTALIERGVCGGAGSSAWSGGLVRLYDPDPVLRELAALSIGLMHQGVFADTYAAALRRTGVIYRTAAERLDDLTQAIEQYDSPQYPLVLIANAVLDGQSYPRCADAERINLYEANACVGNVRLATSALANVVRQHGLLLEHMSVQALEYLPDGDVSIDMGQATLRCRVVVLATGAWSGQLVPQLDLQTRSIPLARIVTPQLATMPVIDEVAHAYAIPLNSTVSQTGSNLRQRVAFPEDLARPDARQAADALQARARLCGGPDGQVLDVLPGFDGYSADGRPLLGFLADDSPLFVATGMSGVGFKLAPGLAQIACEQIQRRLRGSAAVGPEWSVLSPRRGLHQPALARQGVQP
ncbi:FAD-binding oxidoreductase [Pseudomonas brassicacearum]|uniref:FAD-binding oxidoreductase n=1 Tax=Pseudomonas brassicacearum TaxID=930166 RepID=A0A423GZV0_9PSED|nr:FAD-binding oxidoreductase [Pseudomonas brassicacearum]RON03895.1 FAD-binding oxidoreductase [Pseudomonas brassicacearum]